jgi:hypothetical protein
MPITTVIMHIVVVSIRKDFSLNATRIEIARVLKRILIHALLDPLRIRDVTVVIKKSMPMEDFIDWVFWPRNNQKSGMVPIMNAAR